MIAKRIQRIAGRSGHTNRHRAFMLGSMTSLTGLILGSLGVLMPLDTRSVHGTVKDATGHAVPQSVVYLRTQDGKKEFHCECDLGGGFHFDRLPAADYLITWKAPHFYESSRVSPPTSGFDEDKIKIPAASDTALDLKMQRMAVVRGRVMQPDGELFRNSPVSLFVPRAEAFLGNYPVKTNGLGVFELELPYTGQEYFAAILPHVGYITSPKLELEAGKTITQEFRALPVGSLEGQIRSKKDGQPLKKACMVAEYEYPEGKSGDVPGWLLFRLCKLTPELDEQGSFKLENLPVGKYILKVYSDSKQRDTDRDSAKIFKTTVTAGDKPSRVILSM